MEERTKIKNNKLKKHGKRSLIFIFGLFAVYFLFITGYIVGIRGIQLGVVTDRLVNTELKKPKDVDFSLYWEAWNKLKEKTALEADSKEMVQGSISGMLAALEDPYTVYFEPEVNRRFREDISGEFGGIGVEIIQKNNLPTIIAPLSGSPAEKAGLKPNDVVVQVDGSKTTEIGFDETINKIRGESGTKVNLQIAREGAKEPLSLDVTRDTIVVKSIESEYRQNEGKKILYIKIRQFGDDTNSLFNEVAEKALKEKPDGIIVDLRNNPGGYLETSVSLSSYFVDGGVIVSESGKNDKKKEYKTTRRASLKDYKVAVLVNKGSASASEIFSGALQDRGAGKIIGATTFGKGSVQELIDLSDGSAVKITVAKWYTPSGRQISEQGIKPDIEVADDETTPEDDQLNKAVQYLMGREE